MEEFYKANQERSKNKIILLFDEIVPQGEKEKKVTYHTKLTPRTAASPRKVKNVNFSKKVFGGATTVGRTSWSFIFKKKKNLDVLMFGLHELFLIA